MKTSSPFRLLAASLLVIVLGIAKPVSAATFTWFGENGPWDNHFSWLGPIGSVPGPGDTAIINGTNTVTIGLLGNVTVDKLVMDNPNATLRVAGQSGAYASLTVANGFENQGIIELTSVNTIGGATLTVTTGTLTNANSGIIRAVAGTGGPRTLTASLDNRGTVEAQVDLAISRNVTNSGTVNIPAGKTVTASPAITWTHQGGSITGTGTLSLYSGSTLALEADFTLGNYVLNATSLTVNGPGTLLGPPTGEFLIKDWTINAPMIVSGDLRMERNVAINSALAVSPGKTLRVAGQAGAGASLTVASGFENQGIIELTSVNTIGGATLTVTTGTLTNATGGIIRAVAGTGGPRTLTASLDNRGEISVLAGVTLTMNGTLLNTAFGILSGTGTFNFSGASVVNNGTVAPGASPGILSVTGNLPVNPGALFDVEIGGSTAGTDHDRLVLSSPVNLNGTIRAKLINGFSPKKDDAFTVLTYPSRTGSFTTLANSQPEQIAWGIQYGSTSAQLIVLNSAPTLVPPANRTIHAGSTLTVNASTTDPDMPANTFSYSKLSGPSGVNVSGAGLITWNTSDTDANTANVVVLKVTDNGTPSLSDTNSFMVTVNSRPVFTSITKTGSVATTMWTAIPDTGYRLQYKTNLDAATWDDLSGDVTASGATASKTDATLGTNATRFYRVFVLP